MRASRSFAARCRPACSRRVAPAGSSSILSFSVCTRCRAASRYASSLVFAPKRSRPGAGANPHAVLRHRLELDHPGGQQSGQVVGEQLVEKLAIQTAKVGHRMVIDLHPATDPPIGIVLPRHPRDRPALPIPSKVAYSHRANRISGAMGVRPTPPSTAFDPGVEPCQVALHSPRSVRPVTFRQQRFQIARAEVPSACGWGSKPAAPPSACRSGRQWPLLRRSGLRRIGVGSIPSSAAVQTMTTALYPPRNALPKAAGANFHNLSDQQPRSLMMEAIIKRETLEQGQARRPEAAPQAEGHLGEPHPPSECARGSRSRHVQPGHRQQAPGLRSRQSARA